jgi:lipopolysaccharide export LptBFGC system permease protein LptF
MATHRIGNEPARNLLVQSSIKALETLRNLKAGTTASQDLSNGTTLTYTEGAYFITAEDKTAEELATIVTESRKDLLGRRETNRTTKATKVEVVGA